MKKIKIITLIIALLTLISCTDNQKARSFGGTETIKLEPQEKFINITWKQDNLWVVVQDTITKKYYAREKSSFGIMEGKVIIEN
jgi:hypothetical protein